MRTQTNGSPEGYPILTIANIPQWDMEIKVRVTLELVVQAIVFTMRNLTAPTDFVPAGTEEDDDGTLEYLTRSKTPFDFLTRKDIVGQMQRDFHSEGAGVYLSRRKWGPEHEALYSYAMALGQKLFPELIPEREEEGGKEEESVR